MGGPRLLSRSTFLGRHNYFSFLFSLALVKVLKRETLWVNFTAYLPQTKSPLWERMSADKHSNIDFNITPFLFLGVRGIEINGHFLSFFGRFILPCKICRKSENCIEPSTLYEWHGEIYKSSFFHVKGWSALPGLFVNLRGHGFKRDCRHDYSKRNQDKLGTHCTYHGEKWRFSYFPLKNKISCQCWPNPGLRCKTFGWKFGR